MYTYIPSRLIRFLSAKFRSHRFTSKFKHTCIRIVANDFTIITVSNPFRREGFVWAVYYKSYMYENKLRHLIFFFFSTKLFLQKQISPYKNLFFPASFFYTISLSFSYLSNIILHLSRRRNHAVPVKLEYSPVVQVNRIRVL